MALTRTPRSSWVDQGLQALAAGGPDAVRIESLARALGVSKGGFYWHFADRQALLDEMLDTWERVGVDEVIARIDAEGGDATTKLKRLFSLASGRESAVRIELAVREWARRDRAVARRVRRVDNRRVEYMRPLFATLCRDEDEVEARCLLVMALFVANQLVAADHPGRSRADVVQAIQRRLLASDRPTRR